MTKPDTGGPAFAVADGTRMQGDYGMTLLDWFAGQAVAGMDHIVTYSENGDPEEDAENTGPIGIAKTAYLIAEAMIAEKRRREGLES